MGLIRTNEIGETVSACLGDVVACIKDKLETSQTFTDISKQCLCVVKDATGHNSDLINKQEKQSVPEQSNKIIPLRRFQLRLKQRLLQKLVLEAEKKANLGLTLAKLLELEEGHAKWTRDVRTR